MAIAGKVENAIGAAIRESLIARRVDLFAKVFQCAAAVLQIDAPKVEFALPAGHIAGEIKVFAIRTHGGVAII